MTPERWADVERLYHAALALDAPERAAFLFQECGGDEALRGEVTSLLAQEARAGGFLSMPAGVVAGAKTHSGRSSLIGRRLGTYEIQSLLGAGGMGDVYRAHDSALGRDVAIKMLPTRFTGDPDRLGRFKREARTLAALNHPNIGTIYGLEEVDGVPALVLELVEGTTLADRLDPNIAAPREPRLSPTEALTLARQIADALAAAHTRGVVHRDLKPANIMIAPGGVVKVLDFGLAKAALGDAPRPDLKNTPTGTVGSTRDGVMLGTPAYMSPEQARGQVIDTRTDVWAFGCVVFEMLAGTQAFGGDTVSDVIASILTAGPDWRTLPASTPAPIRTLLRHCLEKDRTQRLAHIADARLEIDDALASSAGDATARRKVAWARSATARGATRWTVTVPAAAAVGALAIAGFLYFRRAPTLTDKDTIVLADFRNTTGDTVFDQTLRQGLAVQLEQSPFLSLVSDERVQGTLRLMGQPADAPLTPQLAKDICERTGSAAVLEGSIASLGSQYVLGLRARNCGTGDVLDEEQVQAARKEDVLRALSQIAVTFRTRVGESLATVEKHSTPLEEATTTSLDALKAYSASRKVLFSAGNSAALPFLERAVEIDPQFATAHAQLGLSYSTAGESVLSMESTTKAYQLRDRTSDRERFRITALYDRQVTGNLEKAHETLELWAQTYPRDLDAHGLLAGFSSIGTARYQQAIDESQKVLGIDPDYRFAHTSIVGSSVVLDRLEDAERALRRASERKLDNVDLWRWAYYISFLKGDRTGMDRAAALAHGKPGSEAMTHSEALVLARSGQLQRARTMSGRAVDMARQAGHLESAAVYEAGAAVWEAFFGNATEARRIAMDAFALSAGRDVEYGAAFALALAGDAARTEMLAIDLERRFPEDTSVRFSYVPTLRALVALDRGKPSEAIQALQVAIPHESAVPAISFNHHFGSFYSARVRGDAYLAAHQGAEAAAEFQKILTHRGLVLGDPVGAVARLQLGRAFAMSGDTARAKAAYEDFLTLWKDADTDIPVLQEAKAEYARMR